MTLAGDWGTRTPKTDKDVFRAYLESFSILDIGYITQLLDDNEVMVKICDEANTTVRGELISIGYDKYTISGAANGQYVLVLYPKSNITMSDGIIHKDAPRYDSRYVKCIPIGLIGGGKVKFGVGAESIDISASSYLASFQEHSLQITGESITFILAEDCIGMRLGDNSLRIKNDGIHILTKAEYNESTGAMSSCKASIDVKNDGSISITSNTDKFTLEIDTDGKVTLKSTEGIKLDGDVVITGSLDVANGNFTVDS